MCRVPVRLVFGTRDLRLQFASGYSIGLGYGYGLGLGHDQVMGKNWFGYLR